MGMDFGGDDLAQDIAGAVLGAAFKFAGRGIGKKMQEAYEERIGPAIQAKAAQARQQWQPSPGDQAAIVQRYPDLRCCMHDQVVFLEGGRRTVPITEIRMPVTLAQADAIVDRLRAP
jgi:membrane protease subunit (stomatin/prohibitin family)